MGREIRMVIPNWDHPKYTAENCRNYHHIGRYMPMFNRPYIQAITQWIVDHNSWELGTHPDIKEDPSRKKEYPHFAMWARNPPNIDYYRPNWNPEEMTWFQVYETVSEGTPVTPPFATKEELVDYLVENGDFWDQKRRAEGNSIMDCRPWPRSQAEKFVVVGWAPSMVGTSQGIVSGVQALDIFTP